MKHGASAPAYLLHGQVMHQRVRPLLHRFVYPVFCVRINLTRLAEVGNRWFGIDRRRLMSLRTRDYGPRDGSDLATWMRAQLQQAGVAADGEIWLQTFPRLFGVVFNPVSFWYCHDRQGQLRAVLAEVNNTFGATWRYLLSAPGNAPIDGDTQLSCIKQMHVSPFCEVRGCYYFRFRETVDTALAAIDYDDGAGTLIHTALGGSLQPLTPGTARRALLRQPFMSAGIIVKIHWQAWQLWRRRVPFFGKQPARSIAEEPPQAQQETSS